MNLVLENKDLEQLDKMIQEMPFKYGQPLFAFLTSKLNDQRAKEQMASKEEAVKESKPDKKKPA